MKKIKSLFLIFTVLLFSSVSALAKTQLTVYSAIEAEDLKKYAATFNEDHPDIEINWVRDSTGIVTAKLLAEKRIPSSLLPVFSCISSTRSISIEAKVAKTIIAAATLITTCTHRTGKR